MKSQHPDAIEQTNIELRRSSRNATGNKLSRRRNAKSKSVPESEKTISLQNQSIEILHKTVSPKKQQLPVILESPSICQQQSSIGMIMNVRGLYRFRYRSFYYLPVYYPGR